MNNRTHRVTTCLLTSAILLTLHAPTGTAEQPAEKNRPGIEGVSADGWKAQATALTYESSVDLTKQERKIAFGMILRLTPPEGIPLAARVTDGIVQALDDKGVNVFPPSRELSEEYASKIAQEISRQGALWSRTPTFDAVVRELASLPATVRKVRVRCYLLVPGKTKATEISPVTPTDERELGPGITGRIIDVKQADSLQPLISCSYRIVVPEEWKKLPVWPVQMCGAEGVEQDGRVFAASVTLDGSKAKKTENGWEYSMSVVLNRGKFSPETPNPGKPFKSLRVYVATEARLQTVNVEFDRIDIAAWPGLFPEMTPAPAQAPAQAIKAAANAGWQFQVVGAAYRSAAGTGLLLERCETELHFAVTPPQETMPMKFIDGGLASATAGGTSLLSRNSFQFPTHETPEHPQGGLMRPWRSRGTFQSRFVTGGPTPPVLKDVVARATVLTADEIQEKIVDVPQGLLTVQVTDKIKAQFLGVTGGSSPGDLILNFRSSMGSRTGRSGPLPDYLGPQICGVVPLGEDNKPLAVHPATFDQLSIQREDDTYWARLSVILPGDGRSPRVLKKAKLLATDRPKYIDIEGKFDSIDLRAIPGLFPERQ